MGWAGLLLAIVISLSVMIAAVYLWAFATEAKVSRTGVSPLSILLSCVPKGQLVLSHLVDLAG